MDLSSIEKNGEVLGFQFPGEQQVVLFAPYSGDVMICSVTDWHGLRSDPHSALRPALKALDLLPG